MTLWLFLIVVNLNIELRSFFLAFPFLYFLRLFVVFLAAAVLFLCYLFFVCS